MLKNKECRIETTVQCNANCTICPRESFKKRLPIMPMWLFEMVLDKVMPYGFETYSLFGYGEPLTDKMLEDKIELCSEHETFITTNASLLDKNRAKNLIDAGLSHIRFSVHGLGDNMEKVQRGLNWVTVMDNIINFIIVNGGRVKTSVTAIPVHGESVEELVRFWQPGEFIDFLEVWKPHNWTTGKNFRKITKKRKKTCGRPFSGPLQVNSDGTVMVCCFDTNAEMTVGDLQSQSLESILKGERFEAIREKHRRGDLEGLPCETCDQLNVGDENPLLYSNRDPDRNINCTSSTKFKLKEN